MSPIPPSDYRIDMGLAYVTFDMVRALDGEQAARRFQRWMRGQTMAIARNGDVMALAWDYERWLEAGPIID